MVIVQLAILFSVPGTSSAYTPHAPIVISGNSGFNPTNGVTGGTGTPGDPFIISGWEINATGGTGIAISNTDAYFVIKNVSVYSAYTGGISLISSRNGRIQDSLLSGNQDGIYLDLSTTVTIANNSITGNDVGIETRSTDLVVVTGNDIISNSNMGIWCFTDNITVEDNRINDNSRGLFFYSTANVLNNDISWNHRAGIDLSHYAFGGTISGNAIEHNGGTPAWGGIYFENESSLWTVSHNKIRYNNLTGISMNGDPNHNVVEYNEISYNVGQGVYLTGVDNITVAHNNFIGNAVPQAYDVAPAPNVWDEGCPSGGNYWSDYSGLDYYDCNTGGAGNDGFGDTPYVIDADSQDNYPLMQPLLLNNTGPNVTVLDPNGGEDWTGGSVHLIQCTMYDDVDANLTVWIYYRTNATWTGIPGAQGIVLPVGPNNYSWSVPMLDSSTVLVKVEAKDSSGQMGDDISDTYFTIDSSPPYVETTIPVNQAINVPVTTFITVIFSESMSHAPGYSFVIIPTVTGNDNWTAPETLVFEPNEDLSLCTLYNVHLYYFKDDSDPGNMMQQTYSFNFTTGCGSQLTVTLLNPVGGEDWTGGYLKTIRWNVTDQGIPYFNVTTDIYYSIDGGSSWINIVQNLSGANGTYLWLVPFVNTSSAKVKVCATKPGNISACGTSGLFTIDSTSPQVVQTDPQDGSIDVSINTTVMFYWSEQMNIAYGYISTTPMIAGDSSWNFNRTMYQFDPNSPLSPCTDYSFTLTGFKDDSNPGNNMSAPITLDFKTKCPGPPSVTILSPVGGEYLAGGSVYTIWWTANDAETPFSQLVFYINYTSSVSSDPIAGPIQGANSFDWTLPTINATDVVVNITAIDKDNMAGWDESGPFTIDSTAPSLSSLDPVGWDVPVNTSIDAFFDEPVSAMLNYTKESFGLQDVATLRWINVTWHRVPSGALFLQEFHFVPDSLLEECAAYGAHVNDTFFDRALWHLSNPSAVIFHTVCPPSMSLQTLLGGKDWSGGSKHDVVWSMSDETSSPLRIWMNYSKDGGLDGYPYNAYADIRATGVIAYTWTVPLIDTASARIRVTVMDGSGMKAVAVSSIFQIDSTPPAILTSVPGGGSLGVKTTDDIQMVFTETINRSTAVSAFTLIPDPGGLSFAWQTLGSGKDMLVVSHKPLSSKTDYEISFSTAIKDMSDPGNHPVSPLKVDFSTKPPPNVNPPVAKAVGKNQIQVGERVMFDGSQSTGNIDMYVWTITDNQNNIVDALVGMFVNYTFTQNGRYKVTLVVIDNTSGKSGSDSIDIVVTSNDNAGVLILLSSALIIGGILGGTEIGRMALIMLVAVPMYKRKTKGKEDPETRGMIKGYIMVHPGDTYTDIKRNLSLNDGALTWHLMKLEKAELIKSRIRGARRLYFPANMPLPFEDGGDLHEIEKRMLQMVKTDPGMTVKVLAEELGVSSQIPLYHMRKLSQRGLVSLERKGLHLKIYPPVKRNS